MSDVAAAVQRHLSKTLGLPPASVASVLAKAGPVLHRELSALEADLAACAPGSLPENLDKRIHRIKGDLANIGLGEQSRRVQVLGGSGLGAAEMARELARLLDELAPLLPRG